MKNMCGSKTVPVAQCDSKIHNRTTCHYILSYVCGWQEMRTAVHLLPGKTMIFNFFMKKVMQIGNKSLTRNVVKVSLLSSKLDEIV